MTTTKQKAPKKPSKSVIPPAEDALRKALAAQPDATAAYLAADRQNCGITQWLFEAHDPGVGGIRARPAGAPCRYAPTLVSHAVLLFTMSGS